MEQDPNLQNQEVDPQRNLVTKLINHYEPNVEVTDDYYKSISEKYQDVDTLVTKLINHYEPKSEVTKDYLNGLYGKYGVKKKEQTKPTQAAPLPGLGGVSEEPTPSPSVGQGVLRNVDQAQPRGEAFISRASDLTRTDTREPQVDGEELPESPMGNVKQADSFDRTFEQFAGPSQKLMVSGVDADAINELNRQKEEEANKKEAMRMAMGKEDGKIAQQVSGFEEGIMPGQDIIISNKIEESKAKSSESHWEGGDNYYANVYLNYIEETSPNQANNLRSRIENDKDFFNKQKTDLKSPSAEVVKGGLDIVLGVTQENYVSASEKASGIVDQITELEPQLEKHFERIDGNSYNGTPEQFQEYSNLITQINQLSESQEMRELRSSLDALNSTYKDYETNPDVNILDAYETIKSNYQRQVDAAYYKNSFVSDVLTPITDGVMRSGLGLVSNVTSLINNLNTDNEWGTTDDIAAWAKGAAETYDLRNPSPSKFSRDFYEEVAIVGDYEVELKGGKPTGKVFGSNGYLAQSGITDNILKQYNDDPDLYDKETNFNIRSGLYSSTEVGIDMVMGLMPVAGVFGKGFKAIGASEKLAATLGMSAAIVVQSQDEFVQMAKDAGANDQEALAFGMAQSAAIAGIAAINPIEAKALMRMTGSAQKSLAKKYVQNIVGGMSRKDAAAEVTKSLFSRTASKVATVGKTVLKEAGKEGLEETLEIPAGDVISAGWNMVGGVNTYTEKDIAEYINTFFLAGAGSLPFAFLGLSGDAKTNSKKELTYSATQNIDTVRKLFEENLGKKIKDASGKEVELTQEYIDEHIGQLEELGKMSEVYFSNKNLTEADKIAITDLLSRKRSFESKTTDDVSKNTFQSIINDINSSLNEYINKGSKTPFYVINGVAMSKDQVENRLSDEDFVAGLRNGRIDVRIKNDKEMQSRFNDVVKVEKDTVPAKQKGRLTKFSTAQDGIVGEVTYEDGTKKELTQEEYDALEKQEGLFDVETGTQPVAETPVEETVSAPTEVAEEAALVELKEGEIDITTVFKNPVEKNNEQAVAASNEFKDKAGEYDEGVNDPKFKEENTTVEEISVDDIIPTQERLFEKNLKSPSEGEPLVMKIGDKYYVEDGHHRIGNEINADKQTVSVRIYESDKAKQDAVQKQAAGKVPVQPEAKAGGKVEEGKPKTEAEKPTQEGKEVSEEEVNKVADTTGTKPKNIRDLYNINRDMFGQDRVKSLASAIVMDRAIAVMAKRAGISKAEMYSRLEFRKVGDTIPDGVKFQVGAWHGSPYQFDKFTTEKIGTGEGAQAFGWGLYFTDSKDIALHYKRALSKAKESELWLKGASVKGEADRYYEKASKEKNPSLSQIYEDRADFLQELSNTYDYQESLKYAGNSKKLVEWAEGNVLPYVEKDLGRLYKVSLHKGKSPSEYTWLEWDKGVNRNLINLIKSKLTDEQYKDGFFDTIKSLGISQERYIKDGETLYNALTIAIGSDKAASLFLLENGIDGIKYPAESISRGATSDTARGFNYVVFDENAVSIEEVIKFQKDAVKARGADEIYDLQESKRLNKGGTRFVQEVDSGIIKVADDDAGIIQNNQEGVEDWTPAVIERGSDYVITEKVNTKENKPLRDFYRDLDTLKPDDFKNGGSGKLKDFAKIYGFTNLEVYLDNILYGDFKAHEQWGEKNGKILLVDAGSLVARESEKNKGKYKLQKDAEKARGAAMVNMDGTAVIYAMTDPNVSTPLHEIAHVFEHYLTDAERKAIMKFAGTKEWSVETSEKFARGFEKYLADGIAPTAELQKIFDKFKQWMLDIYNGITGSDIDIQLNDEMRDIYDKMLGKEPVAAKTESEKVKAAKDNLNNVWEKWKQSQNNLGIAFDPKSKANEDMELLEAFLTYIKALGIKTAKDIQKAFNDFTGGEATLDDAGAEFVSESIKEPVTKKTEKELSREVTFTNIYDIIEKVNKRTPKKANPKEVNKRAYQDAYDYLLTSDWFASATDIEQTEAIDDLKKLTGQRRESSPSAQKILGIDSTKEKISVDQKTVRGWMMKDLAEGYKLGKRDAKKVMAAMLTLKSGLQRELVAAMREIKSSGKLSKKQVDAIVNKFQKTNVFNPDAVETFLNYIQKVVDNADYVDSVKTANTTRKQIKRRMKNKDVDNNLVQAAKEFAKINPSKVDDIDAYNQLAEKIKEGLSFSMNSRQGVKFRSAFDISTVEKYSELELKRQNLASDAAFEEMFKEMFGSDFGMTVSEMRHFYAELDKESEKDEVKDKETRAKQAMSSAVKVFDTYSAIINEMLESGVDPFTGEDLDIDSKTKELIKEFMDSDITKLPLKDAIRAVDALNNFVVNQTTGGLEAIVRKRRGEGNVKKLVNDGVKSFKLKIPFGSEKSFMTGFVEAYLNSFASLPNLMDNLFGGVRKGLRVEDAIGLSDVVNGRAAANTKANKVLEQFLDKFSKKEANGESFNTAANMTERGILGFMRRTVISTDEKLRKEEFERRKNLIKESIDKLAQFGDAADYEKSLIYMEAYNKLLEDSNSIEDVESKVDPVNKEAVEWWSEKFNEILPELTETSINIYNTVLENESNYNPDVFKRLNEQDPELTGLDDDSYNSSSGNEKVYDKKNPMLMRVKKPSLLPKGRYVSLDFDVNNFSAYESALVDVNTAAAIQQLKGALESEAFRQLVPDNSDRKILKERITTYVAQIRRRGYVPFGSKQWNMINDISSIFARVGTATSLGGLLQPAKQTLPVFVNTLVNSGMSPEVFKSLAYVFDKDISNAINNSGMPIANRGVASQTTMDDIGKLSDKLSESSGIKLYNGVKFMQDKWMKIFLQEPDAFIARASFLVYYKQELKRKGIDTSKIDWKNHKWNKEAANFAQRMVDRQQNVSDTDLQGLFLTDRTGASPIIRKVLLPFQNFVLNQKNRMYADIKALQYGSKEDKSIAIKSLLGLSAEWASFTIISIAIQEGMYMAAESLISQFKGEDDDEEAKKKRAKEKERRRKMYVRSVGTSAFKDFMSPAPFVDQTLITAANFALEEAGATIDKGGLQFGVDFDKSMYEEYEKEVSDISDEELKLEKSIEYLNYIIEAQKQVDGEMYDVHIQKMNEFNERLKNGMEYQSRIRKDVERYMKRIEVEFKPLEFYGVGKTNSKMADMLGSVGIAYDRINKTVEMGIQASTLEYETESFGRKTVKKIPQELQQAMYIAALAQLSATISLLPSEAASTSNKIQKLIQQEAKTESQLERERKDEIKKRIGDRDEFYKGYESGMYSSINAYSLREYKKNITELTDEEIDKVMYEMGY